MSDERIRRLRDLFDRAVALPPDERGVFVARACAGEPDVAAELQALLAHEDETFRPVVDVGEPGDVEPGTAPSLRAGDRLGPYEVVGAAGAGGMGEVYRARDTRLDRSVAIKVLPRAFAASEERRQRLDREARVISQLSHPHICTLHDVGHESGYDYLVMEFLEGESLAERISRGPIPVRDALEIAMQIAAALDTAHQAGVIHRDLKPANVMLTRAGAKLLDFGIARMSEAPGPATDAPTVARTEPAPLTGKRVVLGTFRYMAPEQLEGNAADARSDVWALGLVIHEMLSGRHPFGGDSANQLARSIIEREATALHEIVPGVPEELARLVGRCLVKNPRDRWQSAGDLAYALEGLRDQVQVREDVASRSRRLVGERFLWTAALLALGVAVAVMVLVPEREPALPKPARFWVDFPDDVPIATSRVSPDGRYLSFTAVADRQTQLLLRPLDGATARPMPGTEGARWHHFWSPDSRFIAFFAEGELRRVPIDGGPPQTLSTAPGTGPVQGGTWGADGTILFDVLEVPGRDGLHALTPGATEATPLRVVDETGRELQPLFPSFLSDGRRFTFLSTRSREGQFEPDGVYLGQLGSERATKLMDTPSYAEYVPPGRLLYVQDGSLLAHPFDLETARLHGEPETVADGVGMFGGVGVPNFGASKNGVLVFTSPWEVTSTLSWRDRSGARLETIGEPAAYGDVQLSPDDRRLALSLHDPVTSSADLWTLDLDREVLTRLTSGARSIARPTWLPDGSEIIFSMPRGAPPFIHIQSLDGGEPRVLLPSSGRNQWPWDTTPDGRTLVFGDRLPDTNWDVWALPLDGASSPTPILETSFRELDVAISPDGRWMALVSDESGDSEVYLYTFPDAGRKVRVSTGGAVAPVWRADGRELFYVGKGDAFVAVPVRLDETAKVGEPVELFSVPDLISFDVTEDGQRLLVNQAVADAGTAIASACVLLDWEARLRR